MARIGVDDLVEMAQRLALATDHALDAAEIEPRDERRLGFADRPLERLSDVGDDRFLVDGDAEPHPAAQRLVVDVARRQLARARELDDRLAELVGTHGTLAALVGLRRELAVIPSGEASRSLDVIAGLDGARPTAGLDGVRATAGSLGGLDAAGRATAGSMSMCSIRGDDERTVGTRAIAIPLRDGVGVRPTFGDVGVRTTMGETSAGSGLIEPRPSIAGGVGARGTVMRVTASHAASA